MNGDLAVGRLTVAVVAVRVGHGGAEPDDSPEPVLTEAPSMVPRQTTSPGRHESGQDQGDGLADAQPGE